MDDSEQRYFEHVQGILDSASAVHRERGSVWGEVFARPLRSSWGSGDRTQTLEELIALKEERYARLAAGPARTAEEVVRRRDSAVDLICYLAMHLAVLESGEAEADPAPAVQPEPAEPERATSCSSCGHAFAFGEQRFRITGHGAPEGDAPTLCLDCYQEHIRGDLDPWTRSGDEQKAT